jgi:hypothetical protein
MRKAEQSRPYPPDYVSAATLAYRLDCSLRCIQDYVRAGMLPAPEIIGNLARWDWMDVRRHIKARNGLAVAEAGGNAETDEYSSGLRKALPPAAKAAAND